MGDPSEQRHHRVRGWLPTGGALIICKLPGPPPPPAIVTDAEEAWTQILSAVVQTLTKDDTNTVEQLFAGELTVDMKCAEKDDEPAEVPLLFGATCCAFRY